MKNWIYSGLLAGTLAVFLAPVATASGWIVVDPIVSGGLPRVAVPTPVHPPAHPVPTPLPHPHPILKGAVSFGLHLQSEEVKVDIVDQVAKTYITQIFSNDTDRNLAGTYLFPLPEDTTFSSFSLQIDGKPVEGKILEAQEARQQYEAIVRTMVDPGLLEYADYKTVRARVFPIPAHGTKKVELEYTQILKADNGLLKYKFPLKAEEDAQPADEIKVNVKLSSKPDLRTIWSPTHTVSCARDGNNKATVSFDEKNSLPDKDFLLYYNLSNKEIAANVLTHRRLGEDGYFMLTLSPPVESKTVEPKDIVLVADTSGSMAGDKMKQAIDALKYVIKSLNPADRFGVVQFSTDVDSFKNTLLPADEENKKKACSFIEDMEARGGTNISGALSTSLMLLKETSDRPAYIVFVTDGEPTVGELDIPKLVSSVSGKRDVRIFDFGVGEDVNVRLLNKLAENHHGTAQYLDRNENIETAISNFYQKIKSPVLCDVQIDYKNVDVKDVYPRELKDIFAGTQILLIGRYKSDASTTVHLTGKLNGQEKSFDFPVQFNSEEGGHSYLPRIWAMRRIAHLTEAAQANGNAREVIDEIVALSRKYGIISAYTSFLVTEPNQPQLPATPTVGWGGGGFRRGQSSWGQAASAPQIFGDEALPPTDTGAKPEASLEALSTAHGQSYGRQPFIENSQADAQMMSMESGAAGVNVPHAGKPASKTHLDLSVLNMSTGRNAVTIAKVASDLRESDTINEKKDSNQKIKTAEDKTFYLIDGFWTDSEFSASKLKPEEIEFGSSRYFELIKENPELKKYFAVGRQVILVLKGHAYKIILPATG